MQREIFGPLLPVKTYTSREEVAAYVNQHDRPLALYPFAENRALQDYYITHVMSGASASTRPCCMWRSTTSRSSAPAAWASTTATKPYLLQAATDLSPGLLRRHQDNAATL